MRQVYDTPDGLEVVLQLSTSDIEVEVRDTTTTTVEIDGYDRETPPSSAATVCRAGITA